MGLSLLAVEGERAEQERKRLHGMVAFRHAPLIDAEQESFSVHAATMKEATLTDMEEKRRKLKHIFYDRKVAYKEDYGGLPNTKP